jgi:hypothetical protein
MSNELQPTQIIEKEEEIINFQQNIINSIEKYTGVKISDLRPQELTIEMKINAIPIIKFGGLLVQKK